MQTCAVKELRSTESPKPYWFIVLHGQSWILGTWKNCLSFEETEGTNTGFGGWDSLLSLQTRCVKSTVQTRSWKFLEQGMHCVPAEFPAWNLVKNTVGLNSLGGKWSHVYLWFWSHHSSRLSLHLQLTLRGTSSWEWCHPAPGPGTTSMTTHRSSQICRDNSVDSDLPLPNAPVHIFLYNLSLSFLVLRQVT